MTTLMELKEVVITAYAKMLNEKPLRSDLIYRLTDLTKSSMLTFTSAYIAFEKVIGQDEELYAHWLNVQLQVMTMLNGNALPIETNFKSVVETLSGHPGGENSDVFRLMGPKKDFPEVSRSYKIALAFRVFLDDVDITEEETPPPAERPAQVRTKQ